ncbi:MAG: glycosyltransferase [Bacteroidota bacterium]
MSEKKNILICPLDWGLGHASRCVPVIKAFIEANANVIIAADNRPLAFLSKEFPDLKCIRFPGYQIKYQRKGSLSLKFIAMLPQILIGIYQENRLLDKIIDEYAIDVVFSDNRFGLWNKKTKCIFMTHQVLIKSPVKFAFIDKMLYFINKMFIRNYSECWIPDFEGNVNLSGDLSHKYKLPIDTYFIEPLSRFKYFEAINENKKIDLLVLLSGPEPQRTIFEAIILKQLANNTIKTVIVQGTPETEEAITISENLKIYSHLDTDTLQKFTQQANIILCRSGYSTIMDMAVFGKKAILVPTPGQTEQEYLANYYKGKKYFYTVTQKLFNLDEALEQSEYYTGIQLTSDGRILKARVEAILKCEQVILITNNQYLVSPL